MRRTMNADDGDVSAQAGPEPRQFDRSRGRSRTGYGCASLARARGFSQQQLATMAGVSRQAVSAVESGLSDPSLRVALALSRALGLTVEEVFGPVTSEPRVEARLLAPLDKGAPACRWPRWAIRSWPHPSLAPPPPGPVSSPPVASLTSGAAPRTGAVTRAIRPLGPPRPTLIIAGCDPALPLLEVPLGLLDPPVSLLWWQCASHEALELAANGLVHAAGSHLRDQSGDYNVGHVQKQFRQGAEVVRFCSWREGLALRPEVAATTSGVADVAAAGLRLVNRQPGSEARLVLDRELARLRIAPDQVRRVRHSSRGSHTGRIGHRRGARRRWDRQ